MHVLAWIVMLIETFLIVSGFLYTMSRLEKKGWWRFPVKTYISVTGVTGVTLLGLVFDLVLIVALGWNFFTIANLALTLITSVRLYYCAITKGYFRSTLLYLAWTGFVTVPIYVGLWSLLLN